MQKLDPISAKQLLTAKKEETAEIEKALKKAQKTQGCITCKKGCNSCCNQHILASTEDILVAAHWLENHPEEKASFLENYKVWEELRGETGKTADKTAVECLFGNTPIIRQKYQETLDAYMTKKIMCPFSKNNLCSIYAVRPYACARHASTAPASHCKKEHPEDPILVNINVLPKEKNLGISKEFKPFPTAVYNLLEKENAAA
jgi:Fe-S-cluster containining protein